MTLSCDSSANGGLPKGIIVGKVTIVGVEDISGTTPQHLQFPVDIGIKLTLDVGKSFQPEMIIAGNFKRDNSTGDVVSWGGGFVIQDLLIRMGYLGKLNEGNTIPSEALESLKGKSFLRLSYVTGLKQDGRPRYSDWTQVAAEDESRESLVARFHRSVAKGYPKNFRPEVLEVETSKQSNSENVVEDAF